VKRNVVTLLFCFCVSSSAVYISWIFKTENVQSASLLTFLTLTMDINTIEHLKTKIEAEYAKRREERNTDLIDHWCTELQKETELLNAKIHALNAKIDALNAKIEAEFDKPDPNMRKIEHWKEEVRGATTRASAGDRDLPPPQPATATKTTQRAGRCVSN
jgi:peptidoglycan hydrolase CwlO-like protein